MHPIIRRAAGALAALLLVSCSSRPPEPPVTLQARDLTPKFLAFYDAAQRENASPDRRWQLWEQQYAFAAVPPTAEGMALARKLLDGAWSRYPAALDRIRAGVAGMTPAPEETLRRVATALKLDRPLEVTLLAYVGGFEDNAFTFANDGKIVVALPVESEPVARAYLMTHEFTHAVHIATAGLSGGWERSIAETIVMEGLAMRMTQAQHPQAPVEAYTEHTAGWLKAMQAQEATVLAGIVPHLAAKDSDTVYRFTVGRGASGHEREAYYVGWRVVGRWLEQGRSFADIARIPAERMPGEVSATLRALGETGGGTAPPPVATQG